MRSRDPAELSAARQRAAAKELGRRQALPNAYAAYEAALLPWQLRMVQSKARRKVSPAGRRSGKLLPLHTALPTPTGWTTMGTVRVGDALVGSDGRPCTVVAKSGIQVPARAYRVEFTDGSSQVAGAEHLWLTSTRQERRRGYPATGKSTEELADTLKRGRRRSDWNHRVVLVAPVQRPTADLPIDPYLLGLWLGDGTSAVGVITSADPEMLQPFDPVLVPSSVRADNRSCGYRIPGLTTKLRVLGVLRNKHIPELYLCSSIEQRKALLSGLMDTDGCADKDGRTEYCTTSPQLAAGFAELCRGLGLRVAIRETRARLYGRDCGPRWRFSVAAPWQLFRLARKAARYRPTMRVETGVYICGVVPVETEPMACVTVDSPDHTYLCGRAFRVTHNTHLMGASIFDACIQYPGATIPVIERTTTCQAARVLWKFLQEANDRYGLGMKFHHSLLIATLPNRSETVIVGSDTEDAANKLRGNKYPKALLDEAGTFRSHILDYVLTDVLDAALLDHRGSAEMYGTPPPRFDEQHPFYRAVMVPEAGWEVHNATFRDNDRIPLGMEAATPLERLAAREAEFQAMLARNGWTEDTPRVRREWLGLFAHDDESLLYALRAANHVGIVLPDTSEGRWYYGLGIDFGYAPDPCAFVVVAWRAGDPRLWVLESYEQGHLIPSAVAAHVERLRSRYQFSFIVGDTGGAGKPYAEELKQRYGIPVEAARKRGKAAYIEMLNGDLASSTCLIVERTNADLIADLYTVRKGEDGLDDQRDHEATHLPDALRYTVTEVRGRQAGLGAADGPAPGSREYLARLEAEMERVQLDAFHHGKVPNELDSEAIAVGMLTD